MKITVMHPRFEKRHLEVVCYLPGSPAGLVVNDVVQVAKRGVYDVRDDFGNVIPISFEKKSPFSSTIKLKVGHDDVVLESPLGAAQLALCFLPMALMFIGGALGGLIGVVATMANFALVSSRLPSIVKYGAALAITVVAIGSFTGGAAHLARLTRPPPKIDGKYLTDVATAASVGVPRKLDEATFLESIAADGENGLVFTYTLAMKREAVPDTFATTMRAGLAPLACETDEVRQILDAGKLITHHYLDADHLDVMSIVIGAADCKKCTASTIADRNPRPELARVTNICVATP